LTWRRALLCAGLAVWFAVIVGALAFIWRRDRPASESDDRRVRVLGCVPGRVHAALRDVRLPAVRRTGAWRGVYYGLLFNHEPIAVISVPLGMGLGVARARAHKEVARPTVRIWGISGATGVLLYLLLYLAPI
jgi:hypothetical protein